MDEKKIFEAIKRRNQFIQEHPELRLFQKYIDDTLNKAGNQHNRMAVLEALIIDKRLELHAELVKLQKKLVNLQQNIEQVKKK